MSTRPDVATDMEFLLRQPAFLRFLGRVVQLGGLFEQVTTGTEGRELAYFEGRRNLALDILHDAETGIPDKDPDGAPLFVAIQIFSEQANQAVTEKTNARGRRGDQCDRTAEAADDDGS